MLTHADACRHVSLASLVALALRRLHALPLCRLQEQQQQQQQQQQQVL
jgi:hypothetical protein